MIYKLNDLIETANTGADAIKRAPILQEKTNLRCLRIGDVSQRRKFNEWGYTKTSREDYKRYKLHLGDIIVARTGNTIGVNQYIDREIEAVYNNGLIRIKVNKEMILPKYFYYIVRGKSCQDYIQSIAYGTSTQPNMKIKDFLNFKIEVLGLDLQRGIVKIIDTIERKIAINEIINDNLEQQAQALFQELFIENADSEWPVGTISDIGTVVGGSTPSKAKPEYYTEDGIAWITPKDLSINKLKFISHGESDITELGLKNSSASIMPEGTVLFSSRAPIGYIAIAASEVTTNQGFKSVVPKPEIGTAYVYYFLKQNLPIIEGMASGSTFKEISGSTMRGVPAVIPNIGTITRFNDFCAPLFAQQRILEEQNQSLSTLRDTLLPKLMSGEIDVSSIQL